MPARAYQAGDAVQMPGAIWQKRRVDPWYLSNLVCPVDKSALTVEGDTLVSAGRRYPVVDGVPVMLVEEAEQTLGIAQRSIDVARRGVADRRAPGYYPETLALRPRHVDALVRLVEEGMTAVDPVALMIQESAAGHGYVHLMGDRTLSEYPIPRIPLPQGEGRTLLDIGCNWGRWCVAAARAGWRPVGIDPSLGAVMAARRVAAQLGIDARFVVGDGRYLPFREGAFDAVYSYSVLQHLSPGNAALVLHESGRVLRPGSLATIQMAAKWGVRNMQHQAGRRFLTPSQFEVRYYGVPALRKMFEEHVGPTRVTADCYFGLGWQWADYRFMRRRHRPILVASELLRRASERFAPLRLVADSVFCTATRE